MAITSSIIWYNTKTAKMWHLQFHQSIAALLVNLRFFYWEYKLVRSVQKCIYFKTKWMNRSIKVLCIAAYYFFPSFKQFSNSLEKMTRLWRRSNFGANFRFLRKKWTSDLSNRAASFGTSNQKEQCPENTAGAVKHPI